MKRLFLLLAFFTLVFASCSKEDDNIDTITFHTYAYIDMGYDTITIQYLVSDGKYQTTKLYGPGAQFHSKDYLTTDIPTKATFDKYIKIINHTGHMWGGLRVGYETPDNNHPTNIDKKFNY